MGLGATIPNSGGAEWTPKMLPNLYFWWRGDSVTLVGGKASYLLDLSGNTRHAVQLNATYQGTWTAADASYNNKPTVTLPNPGYMLCQYGVTLTQSYTVYMVAGSGIAGATASWFFDNYTGGNQAFFCKLTAANCDLYGGTDLIGAGSYTAGAHIITCGLGGASSYFAVDRKATNDAAGNAGTNSVVGFTLGGRSVAPTLSPLAGPVAEVIKFAELHNAAKRTAVTTYLAARYARSLAA